MRIIKTFESFKLNEKVTIDLNGPDGNAMNLVGYVKTIGKQLDMGHETIKQIQSDMLEGDYENLLSIFNKNFGQVVELTGRDDEEFESVKENEVIPIDDLDEAMMELQEVIVQTTDGGVCGTYWSGFDDGDVEWRQGTDDEKMVDVISYLELETSYDGIGDED